jgi:2-oxoglutarate dehydrogenase complex dihydrolipoamide succinyltransferase (E2) component
MKVDVVMPEMGESISEGTIAKWLKKPGDPVERDEAILEITTDKIDSEIPAPGAGVLGEVLVEEGQTVEVGTVLARIDTESDAPEPRKTEEPKEAEKAREEGEPEKPEVEPAAAAESDARGKADSAFSPVARNLARKEGLTKADMEKIEGSGRGGRVRKEDVVRYIESRSDETDGAPPEEAVAESADGHPDDRVEVIEMTPMRRMIAEHMVRSKRTSPHTYTVAEVDMTRIVRFRDSIKGRFERENGFNLTYTPFVLHAAVLALKAHPLVNSSVEGDTIIRKDFINLGVAVALESGLIVPVIKGADEKNLLGLARSAHDLAVRAQTRKLSPEEVQGGTFTVTNPGVFGNVFGLAIINQPQLAILGVGAIKKRPVVVDDAIAIRSIMYLSLSYDHRAIDGALAARFLQEIRGILENYDTERVL